MEDPKRNRWTDATPAERVQQGDVIRKAKSWEKGGRPKRGRRMVYEALARALNRLAIAPKVEA